MAKKLTDITNTYSKFATDQILTETQLNEFLDYFDEQDRLSRICLSGVGIVCGFELSTNNDNHIKITQGAGVTTDGDLIHLTAEKTVNDKPINALAEEVTYTHYRKYSSEKVKYHPHFNKANAFKDFEQIPLLEIVSEADVLDTDTDLSKLDDLRNKVALFYLECYPKEPDTCVAINCENQGVEQVNRLRVLLVDVKHVDRITRTDNLFNSYVTLESYLDAKTVYVPRVMLNDTNTASASELASAYQQGQLLDKSVRDLKSGVSVILNRLGRNSELNAFNANIDEIFSGSDELNLILFQYKYDLLKDLADSYNELKELFLQNYATCCPNISAFPKHLLLGRLVATNRSAIAATLRGIEDLDIVPEKLRRIDPVVSSDEAFRHKFHKSPILLDTDEGNGRFQSVLTRILIMVSPDGFLNRTTFSTETIRITPSNVRVPLGKRAVPFYYRFDNDLMKNWDFDKQNFDRYKSILGYRQASYYSGVPNIANPFAYSIDRFDFYRIEGHQGLPYDTAFEEVTRLKNLHSLPFDIKVLGINVDEFDELLTEKYKCDFKDLGVLLKAWSSEQECIASEVNFVLSSFKLDDPGKNAVEDDFYTIKRPRTALSIKDLDVNEELLFGLSSNDNVTREKSASLNTSSFKADFSSFDAELSSASTSPKSNTDTYVNPVLSYINNEPDTVGYYFDQSLTAANGNYANALAYTLNTINPIISQWEGLLAASTVSLPLDIIVACTSLIELVPSSISQLTESTLDSYNIEIEKLCSYTKQLQEKYREPELASKVSDKTRAMVSLLVNQLTTICCSSQKLKALLEEVEKRKESIIERLNFASFAEKNPGLEHKAGAGPGQTFVLVYINQDVRKRNLSTGNSLNTGFTGLSGFSGLTNLTTGLTALTGSSTRSTGLTSLSASQPLTTRSASSTEKSIEESKLTASSFESVNSNFEIFDSSLLNDNIFKLANDFQVVIPKGAIIADFTLPYLCCSDCAPISFVMPKIPVSLTISGGTYCIDETNLELDLTVTPKDGIVTVVDSVPGVNITGKKLSIDGSIFPTELLGTSIKFKVDGEDTDAELLVSKKPVIDFTIPDLGSNRIVNFSVTGDDSSDFTYNWDFGDGNSSSEREPTHDYSDSGSRNDYIVTLTVQGIAGVCPTIVSHPVNFIVVTVEIDPNTVCENGAPIPFVITPTGATADIQGQGVNDAKTHFDPALVGPGTYPLSFEGNVFEVMTVNPLPTFTTKIIPKIGSTNIDFTVGANDVKDYQWTLTLPDGKKRTSVKRVLSIALDVINEYKPGDEINVSVVISNGCGSDSIDLSWIVPEKNAPTAQLEKTTYCNGDKEVYDFATENFKTNTVLTGPGVNAAVTPPTFSPLGLTPGEFDIMLDGELADTVIIVEKPTIAVDSIDPKVDGLVAITTLPTGVDLSTLEWSFLHVETNEKLHEPIVGATSVNIDFANFFDVEWTEVRVVVSGMAGPCGPVSGFQIYTRPVNVQVELPKYDFCEDDKNEYDFIFTPDNGKVTVTGVGVNTSDGTFIPGGMTPGAYILTASNQETLSVTIHPKPVLQIGTITSNENGLSTSTTLPAGVFLKSVSWTFVDPESKETLHDPIPGTTTIDVNFKDFKNQSWTDVKIILTANSGPCGSITDSETFTKPVVVDVTVTLPKELFCQDDATVYDFIYSPNEPMTMSGVGVNSIGTAFSPSGLPLGPHTLTASDGDKVEVTIIEPGVGTMNPPVYDASKGTVTLSFTPIGEIIPLSQWSIGREDAGDLATSNDMSYVISLEEHKLEPGDSIFYKMNLLSRVCGPKTDDGVFTIPTDKDPCIDKMVTDLNAISSSKPTVKVLNSAFQNTAKVDEVLIIYALLSDLISKPTDVLSGQLNDRIVSEIGNFLEFLEGEINLAMERGDETLVQRLLGLYRMAVGIYATAFLCQDGVKFSDFSGGIKLNTLLRAHFNNKNQSSLISKGLVIFDASNNAPFLAILNEKGANDEPWATIDFIIKATAVLG